MRDREAGVQEGDTAERGVYVGGGGFDCAGGV